MIAAIFLVLATAAPAERPINVVGHAWAPFISPMGEPFRPHSATDDTLARWFYGADRNQDGQITPEELKADADRFFATLDSDANGAIEPEELIHYEWELAPDIQLSARLRRQPGEAISGKPAEDIDRREGRGFRPGRGEADSLTGLQGAARYGLLNMPEPVAAADADFDRAITRAEFEAASAERFKLLDTAHQGSLTLTSLEAMWTTVLAKVREKKHRAEPTDPRVAVPVPLDR